MERKHYLDNIRWVTVLIVVVYHVFYLYNGVGVLGGVGAFAQVQYQDAVLYVVYPWFMVLLYVIAGISARYALEKKSHRQFMKERTLKLLVPSTLGVIVFQWVVGYLNIKIGGGLEMIPKFILYPICVLSGSGPLWFAHFLWLFSLILVGIRKLDKKDKFFDLCGKSNLLIILGLGIFIWISAQILNMPVITVYRFGIYFVSFLIGYFVLAHDNIQDKIEKIHLPLLVVSVLGAIGYVWYYFGTNYTSDACLKSLFTNSYAWIVVLAMIGCFKAWYNKTDRFAAYMTRISFGIYVLHYVVVLYGCYLLKSATQLPTVVIYAIAIIIALVLSVLLYEVMRRIPILRFCVLGVKEKNRMKNCS